MGAVDFQVVSEGKTAKEAFNSAVDEALHIYGHGGYTGSIAEKSTFKKIVCPDGKDPFEYAEEIIESDSGPICDKWGPAGCIELTSKVSEAKHREFLFFGMASS